MMRPSQKKAPISPIPVTVTDEDDDHHAIDPNDVTGLPDAWPTTQRQKRLKAQPTVSDWGTTEESRDFPVEIKATDGAGNEATKTITITVQRDTDGDGDPDVTIQMMITMVSRMRMIRIRRHQIPTSSESQQMMRPSQKKHQSAQSQ
ncbi:hypothetical protein [Streptococcus thermophilus]|uniref:hypothetical protein n=1 Tax=Streptococcus thermophilus TaxID=1308 RepID=UPI0012FEC43F|nr:hypothetical protein [Streptococcus thermophilus]